MQWTGANRSLYDATDDVDFLDAIKAGNITLTEEGFQTSWRNISVGLVLLVSFALAELNALFVTNEYHAAKAGDLETFLAYMVLLFQLGVQCAVVYGCVSSILTCSLGTSATIHAAIEAFFLMEIDDMLVPVIWTVLGIMKGT